MSGNIIERPQSKRLTPIWVQQLRVVAYCRVSTGHEEQQNSLKNQIQFYTEYIQRNPYRRFVTVYYDTASGLRRNHRPGCQQLFKDCRRKKSDLILVKSLSRFERDTAETIKQIRRLERMNIGVYIKTGGINTLTASDSIIDQLTALDQAESQSRSVNIKFGIRHRMRSGKTLLNHTRFLGYTKGPDGMLQIVPEEAEIVRMIFDLYVQGNGVRKIRKHLESHGIKTVTGKSEWSPSTIDRMLSNEKYAGQVLMQKTYTPDFLTGKKEKNRRQLEMYLVENAHEPIIDREIFDWVQEMKGHIKHIAQTEQML